MHSSEHSNEQPLLLSQGLELLAGAVKNLAGSQQWLMLDSVDEELLLRLQPLFAQPAVPAVSPHPPEPVQALTSARLQSPTLDAKAKQAPIADDALNEPEVMPETDPLKAKSLDSLKLRIKDCMSCALGMERKTLVFGQGNHRAELVFVGEGPGEEEDNQGLPFVGKAGKLLTQMIQSIGVNRKATFICNVIKCRPPGNRNPHADEIKHCLAFLEKQLEILNPKLIVTLGNVATKALLPDAKGIMRMRGNQFSYRGITLIPTFHPSYLLRTPSALNQAWDDLRIIRQSLFMGSHSH